jgi:hypothetical protein
MGAADIDERSRGVAKFKANEKPKLIASLFATMVFGWTVSDDFFVVPDHGKQFMYTDHHGVIHVCFSEDQMIEPFITHMAKAKFLVPEELVDETFKKPDWMDDRRTGG